MTYFLMVYFTMKLWADNISWLLEITTIEMQLNLFAFAIQSWG